MILLTWDAKLVRGDHYSLFILTGQSNSLGTTNGGEADPSPGTDPSDSQIRFFWDNIASASTAIGNSGNNFLSLQAQQGKHYPGSDSHWGPEIAFGRTLFRSGMRKIGIIKASRGGGGNTNWSKQHEGHMYSHVVKTVLTATDQLHREGHTFEILGLLYLQGESDSSGEAAVAGQRFQDLVANLRHDLPGAANLHAVIGGIAATGKARDQVRQEHKKTAETNADIDFFDNTDLHEQVSDGLHFNRKAKLIIGQRFAQAFFDAKVIRRSFGGLVCIGDSITQGGMSYPSYRYPLFRMLVANNAHWHSVGSQRGAYEDNAGLTPPFRSIPFPNVHEGHWGWRAFWINGRVAIPTSRISHNRGTGTLRNWTGQSGVYRLENDAEESLYRGVSYLPDTALIMIGSNDLSEGHSTAWRNAQLLEDTLRIVQQLQAANKSITVFVSHIPPVAAGHPSSTWLNKSIAAYNKQLLAATQTWSTEFSTVFTIPISGKFDAETMTHDNVHPNTKGELVLATAIGQAFGLPIGQYDQADPPHLFPQKEAAEFAEHFSGNTVPAEMNKENSWQELVHGTLTLTGRATSCICEHAIPSKAAMLDGSRLSAWMACRNKSWTLEMECCIHAAPHGIAIWAGTGKGRIIVVLQEDETTSYANHFQAAHQNLDGARHLFRIAYDHVADRYFVWRDGTALTPQGVSLDQRGPDSRLLIGDYTDGQFGDGFRLELFSLHIAPGQVYAPAS